MADSMFAIRERGASDAEQARRLILVELLQETHLKDIRPLGRQLIAAKAVDQDASFHRVMDIGRGARIACVIKSFGRKPLLGAASQLVDGHISGDGQQPGSHGAPAKTPAKLGVRDKAKEDLVNYRFLVGRGEDLPEGSIERGDVLAIYARERILFSIVERGKIARCHGSS
jgi:hypothetical protein